MSDIDYAPHSTATAVIEYWGEFASSSLADSIEVRLYIKKVQGARID